MKKYLLLLLVAGALLMFPAGRVSAQVCYPQRTINQHRCTGLPGTCTGYTSVCVGVSGKDGRDITKPLRGSDAFDDCKTKCGEGVYPGYCATPYCDGYTGAGFMCEVQSFFADCSPEPACQSTAVVASCDVNYEGTSCTEITQTLIYGCWGPGATATPTPTGIIPPPGTCPNYSCDGLETCSTCPADCGACSPVTCGNGMCDIAEDCNSCPDDCNVCPPPPPTPTPTPWIRVRIKNTSGVDVPVSEICQVRCNNNNTCNKNASVCSINSADFTFQKGPAVGLPDRGGRIELLTQNGSPLDVIGVTPSVVGRAETTCNQLGGYCYVWNLNSWSTGGRDAVFIVATPAPIPGTVLAQGRQVDEAATTCTDVANGTPISDTLRLNPNVAPGAQTVSGESYATWTSVPSGITYQVIDTPPPNYVLKFACWQSINPTGNSTGISAYVAPGQTVTWQLGYTMGTPWLQTQGGDVYAQGAMKSYIPPAASPLRYFSLDGDGGSPGFIQYGTTYDFDGSPVPLDTGGLYISSKGWIVHEQYVPTDYYAVMYHRFDSPTTPDYPAGTILATKLVSRATPYYVPGDLTIDSTDWVVGATDSIVVIVTGNLTINKKITITPGGFITFIVKGNIQIDPVVGTAYNSVAPVLEGIYITSGTFQTGVSSATGSERFVAKGTFVANNFLFQRDLGSISQNQNYASELFLYNPHLQLLMPDVMKNMSIFWQEVAP